VPSSFQSDSATPTHPHTLSKTCVERTNVCTNPCQNIRHTSHKKKRGKYVGKKKEMVSNKSVQRTVARGVVLKKTGQREFPAQVESKMERTC